MLVTVIILFLLSFNSCAISSTLSECKTTLTRCQEKKTDRKLEIDKLKREKASLENVLYETRRKKNDYRQKLQTAQVENEQLKRMLKKEQAKINSNNNND